MTLDEQMVALAKVFGVTESSVHLERDGTITTATIDHDGEDSASFTFAQMAQLPAIFGTEHIDFSTESGHSRGSSWTGDYGHYNNLIIKARL